MALKLITNKEKGFRDNVCKEYLDMTGSIVTFYSVNKVISKNDILYGDAGANANWDVTSYTGMKVFFGKPDLSDTTLEGGRDTVRVGTVEAAKITFDENGILYPTIGDIFFHPTFLYYEITEISRDGYYADGHDDFIKYVCNVERNDKYPPEKKLNIII